MTSSKRPGRNSANSLLETARDDPHAVSAAELVEVMVRGTPEARTVAAEAYAVVVAARRPSPRRSPRNFVTPSPTGMRTSARERHERRSPRRRRPGTVPGDGRTVVPDARIAGGVGA
ncbi:hypothetical protein A4G99_14855 [Haladaptatus sp. R4]|uniref:hypothetical protein n=1 Tax=Haladaptatus sp. R4 TaxID=1679489 RepID=UPI0007B45DE7|nr:hypothetical protein [Haladaptatus sp. R4]KZN23309.1 hypothetical protein A4G99_14855 [Haladaptatus sp. R4]